MKKILVILILLYSHSFANDKNDQREKFQIEVGTTVYGVNIAFAGFDVNLGFPFYQKGINTLLIKTSLLTYIPSSIYEPVAPYILFGGLAELQYSISLKNGFLFSLETGLGIASEFFQTPVYSFENNFQKNFISSPYGIFSAGLRMGYDFNSKFNQPFKLNLYMGYRMQFPFNFTIKHFILYGVGFSYTFDFGRNK